MPRNLTFQEEKTLQILLYIAGKAPIPDTVHVLKILYQADKEHLEGFGRAITNDQYVAMEYGPVASQMFDLIKGIRNSRPNVSPDVRAAFTMDKETVVPLHEADMDYISQSERQCLDSAIAKLGEQPFGSLSDQSHDDAYDAAIRKGGVNSAMEVSDIVATLSNSEMVAQHIADSNPGGDEIQA